LKLLSRLSVVHVTQHLNQAGSQKPAASSLQKGFPSRKKKPGLQMQHGFLL
jgi:hypothetical protein